MATISAIIITKNEINNIEACLSSVSWVDEVIVLDSGSTDRTQEVCKKYVPKVKLYEADWPGFGKQKNRAIEYTTSDWLLFIDADERVTNELRDEILKELDKNSEYNAYTVSRQNYFLGRKLKYCCGKGENESIRLVKKGRCKFSEDVVHESMSVTGGIGQLHQELSHFSRPSLEALMSKTNRYSTLAAVKLGRSKASFGLGLLHAIWAFIRTYFISLGFLDGWPGFIVALSNFEYTFYKYAKLVEKNKLN